MNETNEGEDVFGRVVGVELVEEVALKINVSEES